jgi:myo-inositol-1(or 4)-monophosphatase
VNLLNLQKQVIAVAQEVGDFIRKEALSFSKTHHTEFKGKNNLVSYVDKEAEKILVEQLSKLLPEAGFIAEEGTGERKIDGLNWVIDPLDGTTNFIHGLPIYSISIALIDEQEDILLGIVHEVNHKECFYALKGGGAWLDGERIFVSETSMLSESLIATGFPYYHEDLKGYLHLLYEFLTKSHGFRRIGSAAVDLAYVACGRFEAFYEQNLNPWDVAAGALLVTEAGGKVSDFKNGSNFIFGKQILATGRIHKEMLEVISDYHKQK